MLVHYGNSLSLPVSIVVIGAFDGVHKGHQKLIGGALQKASELQVPLVVYTFDPPPKVYFKKAIRLASLQEKLDRLERLGVHHVVVRYFDSQYASRKADEFHKDIQQLNPLEIRVGSDFRYGIHCEGNVNTLKEHFSVHMVEHVRCNSGEIISSSRIRQLLQDNRKSTVEQLLGWEPIKITVKEK